MWADEARAASWNCSTIVLDARASALGAKEAMERLEAVTAAHVAAAVAQKAKAPS
jgi:hypothetical protein